MLYAVSFNCKIEIDSKIIGTTTNFGEHSFQSILITNFSHDGARFTE